MKILWFTTALLFASILVVNMRLDRLEKYSAENTVRIEMLMNIKQNKSGD